MKNKNFILFTYKNKKDDLSYNVKDHRIDFFELWEIKGKKCRIVKSSDKKFDPQWQNYNKQFINDVDYKVEYLDEGGVFLKFL